MVRGKHASKRDKGKKFRSVSLDVFRAVIILLFIFFNFLGTFVPQQDIPFFLKHNQGDVLLFVDLIAPAFAFILGASLCFSHQNSHLTRAAFEFWKTLRFLQLIFIGILLDGLFCNGFLSFCLNWGVLQSLGLGGLFALLFIELDNRYRIVICLLLLAVYSQVDVHSLSFPSPDPFRHGGVIGGIGYGFVSLLGVISAEMFRKERKKLVLFGAALLVMAIGISGIIPFNKLEVSASFVLVSSALSIFFWLILSDYEWLFPKFLKVISRKSLILWALQYVVVWYPVYIFNLWSAVRFDFITGAFISVLLTVFLAFIVVFGRELDSY